MSKKCRPRSDATFTVFDASTSYKNRILQFLGNCLVRRGWGGGKGYVLENNSVNMIKHSLFYPSSVSGNIQQTTN